MATKFNLYKDEKLVKSVDKEEIGTTAITIDSLEADTDYPEGTYTVSFSNESGESQKVNVPQFKTKAIGLISITLDVDTLDLTVKETHQLNVTFEPSTASNQNVKYESDSEHATVTPEGLVEAVSVGSANITVTSEDGSHTDVVAVTVKEPIPSEPTNVQVSPGETSADISVE
ncbi:tail morphogenetic protein H [Staphylococcus phage Twort]|uniref:Tail morphogenetic protein H n=1 Tax=Staphylococcus phage Twort (strain DSM 17442 / HER 48) TaxID=2908167 RepID=A0A6H0X5G1_BPTWO|nr:tail morphogenetic protein H [Staphylococcus phage Twort]